jgi:hypothetical protein
VQPQTRVWDFSFAQPLNVWLDADASPRTHLENQSSSLEPASVSPHAARGAGKILSNQAAGKIIGWPTGQAAAGRTVEMARNLTAEQVAAMQARGLNRATVESLRGTYQKAIEAGGAKLRNEQLLPRAQLMDRILELWPK